MSERLIPFEPGFMDPFDPINRQPQKQEYNFYMLPEYIKDIPVCPQYQLVEICAELAGIDPEELSNRDKFCGFERFSPLPYLMVTPTKTSYTMCSDISLTLTDQLSLVAEKTDVNSEAVELILKSDAELAKKKEVLDAHLASVKTHLKQQEILSNWREIIFNTCYVHTDDTNVKSEHIKKVTSPEELTDDEVIEKVKSFLSSLIKNAAGEKTIQRDHGHNPGANCPQKP